MGLFEDVYRVVQKIPKGKVMTYGQVAKMIGTKDARRVGQALHANKNRNIPCHRVVFADGSLSESYIFGGKNEQKKKLIFEGVHIVDDKVKMEV